MARRISAKQIFEVVSRISRLKRPAGERGSEKPKGDPKLVKRILKQINRCVDQAFRAAKLDPQNEDDWQVLATWLAVAVYAGRHHRGRPTGWTRRRLLRLIDDIERVRPQLPQDTRPTDKACCDKLIKELPYKNMKGKRNMPLTSSALRRNLSRARLIKQTLDAASVVPENVPQ
jgi:hypothetical protein